MPVNLSDVQGNILKGFNKSNVRLVFFKFGKAEATMDWLANITTRIKSTEDLKLASKELHAKRELDPNYKPRETLMHVSLSKSGIEHLIIKNLYLPLPPSRDTFVGQGKDSNPKDQFLRDTVIGVADPFKFGMTRWPDSLGDVKESAPKNWEELYKGDKIDALFIVASDHEDDIESYVTKLIEEAGQNGATCTGIEAGKSLLNEQGKQVEHFGFRDGVSQPLITGIDDQLIDERKDYKDAFFPEDFVLSDLPGKLSWANNGSFLVYRKLEQNVAGFWNFLRTKYKMGETTRKPEELAALLVGRWKSGAPLAVHNFDPVSPKFSSEDDFVYMTNGTKIMDVVDDGNKTTVTKASADIEGDNTPKFAHTRWSNPRDSERSRTMLSNEDRLAESNKHRILRRGIPYGAPWGSDTMTKEAMEDNKVEEKEQRRRGLLFICYQRDIEQQFEFIQRQLSNTQNWRTVAGSHKDIINLQATNGYKKLGIEHYVTTKGGEYFFSPSISALKNLKDHLVKQDTEPINLNPAGPQ